MAEQTVSGGEGTTEYMLTTVDNPYDPFTQFDQWFNWDRQAGYNTPGLLARIVVMSDDMSEVDQFLAIQDAIEEIVQINALGVHRKVKRGEVLSMNQTVS